MSVLNFQYGVFFILGLLVGSFLNVVIYRMPLNLSVVSPRSSCPKCNHMITWYENIPVLSYLFLRGKCSQCGAKISWRYPALELFVGLIALFLAPKEIEVLSLARFVFFFSVACVFVAHFLIDFKHQILPDKLNLYLLGISLPYVIYHYSFSHWLIGGLIGFFGPYGITYLFYKWKGQIGLGGGDIKLFGILGLILGPLGVLNNIFMSCMLGSVFGTLLILSQKLNKNTPFAFGPYIIITASLQIFFPGLLESINPLLIK